MLYLTIVQVLVQKYFKSILKNKQANIYTQNNNQINLSIGQFSNQADVSVTQLNNQVNLSIRQFNNQIQLADSFNLDNIPIPVDMPDSEWNLELETSV